MSWRDRCFLCSLVVLFVLAAPVEGRAQTFFVQGEDGADGDDGEPGDEGLPGDDSPLVCDDDRCSLEGSLVVTGDFELLGAGTFPAIEAREFDVPQSIWLPDCPSGYERDLDRDDITLCVREIEGGGVDEMVKVGDIWVDRYEASLWENASCSGRMYVDEVTVDVDFPYHGGFTEPLYACSVAGVEPAYRYTWFQAVSACAASGKHLLTNAEYQAAVIGTHDPGPSNTDFGVCVTTIPGDRSRYTARAGTTPGGSDSCISVWGAEDLVGNRWETLADLYGQGADGEDGYQAADYFNDGYWNVVQAQWGGGAYGGHFSPVMTRGGPWNPDGNWCGPFMMSLDCGAGWVNSPNGFRCARGL